MTFLRFTEINAQGRVFAVSPGDLEDECQFAVVPRTTAGRRSVVGKRRRAERVAAATWGTLDEVWASMPHNSTLLRRRGDLVEWCQRATSKPYREHKHVDHGRWWSAY